MPFYLSNYQINLQNQGLLIGKGGIHGNVLRIKPPMCITKKDVDFAVDIIAKSIKQYK